MSASGSDAGVQTHDGGHSEPHSHSDLHGHPEPHSHPASPPHEHAPAEAVEVLPEPSGTGSVMVDIGGNVGAVIVTTPARLDGEEIEIRPEPGIWIGEHVAVRPRPLAAGTVYAAFFPSLTSGSYLVRVRFGPDNAPEVPLEVVGAQVTQVVWPEV